MILLSLAAASLAARSQSQPPVLKTGTTGVVIDVSVVDAKGQPVLDLSPGDFEIQEDGVKQQILSVRLVHRGAAPGGHVVQGGDPAFTAPAAAAAASTTMSVPESTPSVTAILFDRLSPEVRPFAHRAALAYVATLSPPSDYAGVFLADASLKTFQAFTNKPEGLRTAIDRVAAAAPTNTAATSEPEGPRIQGLDPGQSPTAGAEAAGGFVNALDREARLTAAAGQDPSEALMARIELRMREEYLQFLSELEGQSSLAGLSAVVDSLSELPGRKSIMYFTENLPITARLKSKFDTLIGKANRAHITIYPVDAAGLRVHSKDAELARDVSVAGAQGIGDANRSDGPWTRDLERQEQMLSSRPTAVLGRLAKETGGFLLENTNNLAAGVARMQEERTTYYLVGYQPTKGALDGTFRKVTVKVARPKLTVRSRPGYVALCCPR